MDDFYYRKLNVYHLSKQLVIDIYSISKKFPASEQFGLTNQIQRAAVSIPSNIAEGFGRESNKEFKHFLSIARGSLFEVKTQLQLAQSFECLELDNDILDLIEEVGKLISGLSKSLPTID